MQRRAVCAVRVARISKARIGDALHALGGDLAVLKVAMKPGKPLAAGRLGSAVFIGLPGNPLAASKHDFPEQAWETFAGSIVQILQRIQ